MGSEMCIRDSISSWAAAVASYVEDGNGLTLFIRAIPFNFYAILTVIMMIGMAVMKLEFGPMAKFEEKAEKSGDLFNGKNPYAGMAAAGTEKKGSVPDLVLPIVVLILCCIVGMIYSGGFFEGASFVEAFSNSDASVGLMLGSVFALFFTVIYYCLRKTMTFRETMDCIPEGFRAMVPAILILTFAGFPWGRGICGRSGQGFRRSVSGISARSGVPDRVLFGLCHRYKLGHLWYPDPYHP